MTLRPIEDLTTDGHTPGTAPPELAYVPICDLRIDTAYQRPIEKRGMANIGRIAANFEWGRFTPLLVARLENGLFAVIDGQHRAHAALSCGITEVPALITDLDPAAQAAAFSWVNGSVTALTQNQIFRAALAALEPWAVQCDAAVVRAECRLMPYNKTSTQKKPGEVFCISVVRKFVDAGQSANLIAVLSGIKASNLGDNPRWYNAGTLAALVPAAAKHGVTRSEVIEKFLNFHDLALVERYTNNLRSKPQFAQKSFNALYRESVAALFDQYLKRHK